MSRPTRGLIPADTSILLISPAALHEVDKDNIARPRWVHLPRRYCKLTNPLRFASSSTAVCLAQINDDRADSDRDATRGVCALTAARSTCCWSSRPNLVELPAAGRFHRHHRQESNWGSARSDTQARHTRKNTGMSTAGNGGCDGNAHGQRAHSSEVHTLDTGHLRAAFPQVPG